MKEEELRKKIDELEINEFTNLVEVSSDFNSLFASNYLADSSLSAEQPPKFKAAKKFLYNSEQNRERPVIFGSQHSRTFGVTDIEGGYPQESGKISYPEKSKLIEYLTELLNQEYKDVEIQSIKRQETTRVPISIITFTHEPGPQLERVYVKDYKGREDIRKKDIMIPIFLAELGLPTAKVIGYDYKNGEFTNRFAFLTEPTNNSVDCVYLSNVGRNVYTNTMPELNPKMLIRCGESIINLMVMMQMYATSNLDKLKEKYNLELGSASTENLINERLLVYLNLEEKNEILKSDFKEAYLKLDYMQTNKKGYFCHGDFTPNNIIVGRNLNDYFLIDWELSRKDASILEDIAMFSTTTLGARQDRKDIVDLIRGSYIDYFLKDYNELAEVKLNEKDFNKDFKSEELRSLLYKIGDQIWTQERFGESDARKYKAQWYLSRFFDIINGSKEPVLTELKKETLNLFKESKNVDYLQSVVKSQD